MSFLQAHTTECAVVDALGQLPMSCPSNTSAQGGALTEGLRSGSKAFPGGRGRRRGGPPA